MKRRLKTALIFVLVLLPVALIAGYLTGRWQVDTLPAAIVEEAAAQLGGVQSLAVITAVQAAGYVLVLGFAGCLLAQHIGLWKSVKPEKKPLLITFALSLVFGILFSLDLWTFGKWEPLIAESAASAVTPLAFVSAVLYGGVVEEIMLRLFFMTGIAFVLGKIFCAKTPAQQWKPWVFITANIIAALVFAAGHLPATLMLFGGITPLLLARCFLLNGGFGMLFGWLYRKYGIQYAMVAHAGLHIVSKVIWLLFI